MTITQTMKKRYAEPGRFRQPARQRGATLLVGIIFLIVLMLLGISAATISSLDERMARNDRDRNIAFQAAEAALADAREDIAKGRQLRGYHGFPSEPGTCGTESNRGLCRPAAATQSEPQEGAEQPEPSDGFVVPLWESVLRNNKNLSVEYGSMTGLANELKFHTDGKPGSVKEQPRYIIEILPDLGSDDGMGTSGEYGEVKVKVLYRISALGFGSNEGTNVLLQEVVRPQ